MGNGMFWLLVVVAWEARATISVLRLPHHPFFPALWSHPSVGKFQYQGVNGHHIWGIEQPRISALPEAQPHNGRACSDNELLHLRIGLVLHEASVPPLLGGGDYLLHPERLQSGIDAVAVIYCIS
jgi:hypothetical protein